MHLRKTQSLAHHVDYAIISGTVIQDMNIFNIDNNGANHSYVPLVNIAFPVTQTSLFYLR